MTKNRIGPSLVPWGTPAFTGNQLEIVSPSLTRWRRFERKLIIYGISDLLTPRLLVLLSLRCDQYGRKLLQSQGSRAEDDFQGCLTMKAKCVSYLVDNRL